MIDQIFKNFKCLNSNQEEELKNLLENNTNIKDYFESEIKSIFNKWHEEYKCFDIPSGIITISVNDNNIYLPFGKTKYNEDTIFDIASMTKMYTEMILFDFMDDYGINLDTKIKDMVDFYDDIKELTIRDLIAFNNEFKTKIDSRDCTNKKDAINAIRTSYLLPDKIGYYKYTDVPIIILTDLLETYSNKSYEELFDKYIIKKYDLHDTYLNIDSDRYVTYNKGLTNDPKANIMGGYYGHCGVKTTSKDFIKFFSKVLSSKYIDLFITPCSLTKDDGTPCPNKALMGNANLPLLEGYTLASSYVTGKGFAIQGSVRCHAETCIFEIDNKEYRITSSLFMDLYTQCDNLRNYEKETGKELIKEYDIDNQKNLIMTDIRPIMPYTGTFKELTNLMGICRTLELYNILKNDNNL